jgi:NitT/TauT family transport system ATP-binding protein
MIELSGISFAFSQPPPIFEDFNWRVSKGASWAVLGPSGCGKTTLLYLLAGLRFPSAGEIRIHNSTVSRPRPQTGLILQDYGLLPWATVRENASLGFRIRNFYGPDGTHAPVEYEKDRGREEIVDLWLKRVGLGAIADQYPNQISGGQRQRTAIARTLVLGPDLLLMDEPFSSVDAPTRESLQNLTQELCEESGITLILVTHAIEEAAYMGKKILLLSDPPNRRPVIIENPEAGNRRFRDSQAYQKQIKHLRGLLEEKKD